MGTNMAVRTLFRYHSNGQKEYEGWLYNELLHRVDGPAYTSWYDNGQPEQFLWYIEEQYHRADGPAVQVLFRDGRILEEKWWVNGKAVKDYELEEYKKWLTRFNLLGKKYILWTDEEKVLRKLSCIF